MNKISNHISGMGATQFNCLDSLRIHKYWREGHCGWIWDTPLGTKKLLDALVKRGLAQVDDNEKYTITNLGLAVTVFAEQRPPPTNINHPRA